MWKTSITLTGLLLFGAIIQAHAQVDDDKEAQRRFLQSIKDLNFENASRIEPPVAETVEFFEDFQAGEEELNKDVLVRSKRQAYLDQYWEVAEADSNPGILSDLGLVAKLPAKKYGLTMLFDHDVYPGDQPFVVQYEVRLQEDLDCGGAYIKLVSAHDDGNDDDSSRFDPKDLGEDTPYAIMFGPDRCGATDKVHFIIRHKNPVSGEWSEHHMKNPPKSIKDTYSHLYTLIIRPDNTFFVLIDGEEKKRGSLLEDLDPPVNPPETIPDPDDEKPSDWEDEPKIPDPDATKPPEWDENAPQFIEDPDATKPPGWLDDEPLKIPDPEASKPEDWDEEEDGEWEAPLVDNPKCDEAPGCGEWKRPMKKNPHYKGKWAPPMIDNPNYKGPWEPSRIPNPNFFEDSHPHRLHPIAGIAIEIWTMSGKILFDNFLVSRDEDEAIRYGQRTTVHKQQKQKEVDFTRDLIYRRLRREEDLKEGGWIAYFNYAVGEIADTTVYHPKATVAVGLVLFLTMMICFLYPMFKSGSAMEEDEEEKEELRKLFAQSNPQRDSEERKAEDENKEQNEEETESSIERKSDTKNDQTEAKTSAPEPENSDEHGDASQEHSETGGLRKRATAGKKE
eukprot:gb/GECG01011386.1/.p1 GENE.gb/GECG01011386.1/~~gb/GECG01011386.1/.p1  ORF type:complete len:618 (+),score=110.40 gb/GECG01011386.1/:1-1854(+)